MNTSTGPYLYRPIRPIEIWNDINNITIPPNFTAYTDGSKTKNGLVQLHLLKSLINISNNIYELETNSSLLSTAIVNNSLTDISSTLYNVLSNSTPS